MSKICFYLQFYTLLPCNKENYVNISLTSTAHNRVLIKVAHYDASSNEISVFYEKFTYINNAKKITHKCHLESVICMTIQFCRNVLKAQSVCVCNWKMRNA